MFTVFRPLAFLPMSAAVPQGSTPRHDPAPTEVRTPGHPAGGTEVYFTTNPGLEDVATDEFRRRARTAFLPVVHTQPRPLKLAGHVLVQVAAPWRDVEPLVWQMRSIYHVLRPVHGFRLDAGRELDQIQACLRHLSVPDMETAASFRVTTRRIGRHDFTSIDVQRIAGAALVERYGRPVDLTNYAVNVRVDVFEHFCMISLQVTRANLGKRPPRPYRPRAALKPPVAYAMLQFAGLLHGGGALLDPFCGSGTILTEAAAVNPELQLFGSDLFTEALDGVRANLAQLELAHKIDIRQADARALTQHFPASCFRAIVTNPPYGVILGQHLDFRRFYYRFLVQAGKVLVQDGMLVLLCWKTGELGRALRDHRGFRQLHVRVVETGGLYPRIFVLQRGSAQAAIDLTPNPEENS